MNDAVCCEYTVSLSRETEVKHGVYCHIALVWDGLDLILTMF